MTLDTNKDFEDQKFLNLKNQKADLRARNFSQCIFENCDFTESNFTDSKFTECKFNIAELRATLNDSRDGLCIKDGENITNNPANFDAKNADQTCKSLDSKLVGAGVKLDAAKFGNSVQKLVDFRNKIDDLESGSGGGRGRGQGAGDKQKITEYRLNCK